jgi:hypothetical protein
MSAIKITRREYLADSAKLHHGYYAQFVTERVLNIVREKVKSGELDLNVYAADKKCEYASDRKIRADYFGHMLAGYNADVAGLMRMAGDYLTFAGSVCVMKAAADILLSELGSK